MGTQETHSPSLPIINAESFSRSIESDAIVVVLAWVSWDPARCRLDARLRQARDSHTNLHLYAMDIDQEQNWPFATIWAIATTPTLICIFNSALHEKLVGLRPEPEMKAKLSEWNSLSGR